MNTYMLAIFYCVLKYMCTQSFVYTCIFKVGNSLTLLSFLITQDVFFYYLRSFGSGSPRVPVSCF